MSTKTTTDTEFKTDVSDGLCVVDFWATWCGPCLSFAPIFERSAQDNPGVKHLKMDVDSNPGTASELGIMSIPTIVFYKDGEFLGSVVGAMGERQLAETIERMRDL